MSAAGDLHSSCTLQTEPAREPALFLHPSNLYRPQVSNLPAPTSTHAKLFLLVPFGLVRSLRWASPYLARALDPV